MLYGEQMLEAVAMGWLERANVPFFLITDNLKLVWTNKSAAHFMRQYSLRSDAFGFVKSSCKDTELRGCEVRRQLQGAIASRHAWPYGTTTLTFSEFPQGTLQLCELSVGGSVLVGCSILVERDGRQDISVQLQQYGLTNTERKVISMLANGATATEIALTNGSSLLTVRTHIKRAYEKMQVNSREKMFARLTSRSFSQPAGGPIANV
jgi:DNA-binding CsgD family transcriptional regulator